MPLVEVVWTDASANFGDEGSLSDPKSVESFGGLIQCRDVGYLIHKDAHELKLAISVCPEDNDYRHSNTIPRRWVNEIIYLTRPEANVPLK